MIPLNTTWDTVLMLLIAGGVGLIGGIAAGFLEMRRPDGPIACSRKRFFGSVFLGGIAAVAILYFFPPEESVVSGTEIVNQYNLTRLVALALIIGSAGTNFLISMQARTMALVAEKQAKTTEETANQAIGGIGTQVPVITKASVEATSAPVVQKAMEEATKLKKRSQVTPVMVQRITEDLGAQARESMEEQISPVVKGAWHTVRAAGPSEADDPISCESGESPKERY